MSESNGTSVWVGDLDRCISISHFDEDDDRAAMQDLLAIELEEIGELQILAGKSISAELLYKKGITPSEWRHALHQSEMTVGFTSANVNQNTIRNTDSEVIRFVKGMLDLGRPYAIARYARWEHLDYPSALTATLPYGISALVNQLLASEGILRTREIAVSIRAVLEPCEKCDTTAYRRTGLLQTALHRIANDTPTHSGAAKLNRERMRAILALARLYFSTVETKLSSLEELRLLLRRYELERANARQHDVRQSTNGRFIRSWRMRHIQPLFYLYPYSIRQGLQRALTHGSTDFDRTALVNELALAHCGLYRMREAGKARKRANRNE